MSKRRLRGVIAVASLAQVLSCNAASPTDTPPADASTRHDSSRSDGGARSDSSRSDGGARSDSPRADASMPADSNPGPNDAGQAPADALRSREGAADAGGVPSTLCIGGQLYSLGDHDEFDRDSTLSVSDEWPTPAGTEWSNRYSWGRTNNAGTDDAYYPALADLAAWGLPDVAHLLPGIGLALDAYPAGATAGSAEETALCAGGTCRGHLAGLLSSTKAYASGYWVYNAQLPSGNGWWPAVWELDESFSGCYDELDNVEQWSPDVFGPGSVSQTEQLSNGACAVDGGKAFGTQTTVTTSDSAFHTYGALATPDYVGFYIDAAPTTKRERRYALTPLNPIMQVQVCVAGWCLPHAGATETGRMLVQYYRYYAPPSTPTSCPMPYDLPALQP